MLTRSEVARSLGKSIATVRRMEGSDLHPVQNGEGIWMFDESEVRKVARERGRKRRAAIRFPAVAADDDWYENRMRQRERDRQEQESRESEQRERESREAEERRQVEEQENRERLAALERQVLEQSERDAQRVREAERQEQIEDQQLTLAACDLVETLNSFSPRQLAEVDVETWECLDELMRRLAD